MFFLHIIIVLVLIFDFINGFQGTANLIVTIISIRVLFYFSAVLIAAIFPFITSMVFPLIATITIGKCVVAPDAFNSFIRNYCSHNIYLFNN